MPTVYLADEHRHEFRRLFAEWQRDRGHKYYFVPPEARTGDGKLAIGMIPDEFVALMRRQQMPLLAPPH